METALQPVTWKRALLVILSLLLVSCGQDDTVVIVACDEASGGLMPVTAEVSDNGKRVALQGYLNARGLSLGTIVRSDPASMRSNGLVEMQGLTPSPQDLSRPAPLLRSIAVRDGLQPRLGEEIRVTAGRAGVDLNTAIIDHTGLYLGNAVVRSLRDLVKAINSNSEIVETMRSAPDARFAIVSGTIDGDGLVLFNEVGGFAAANTLVIGNSYVHVSYACPAIAQIKDRATNAGGVVPMVIYLMGMRYDQATSQVVLDPRPQDFVRSQ